MNHITLPLKDIAIGKNIRADTSNVKLGDLVESIRSHGLLENLIVQKAADGAKTPFRLVAGFQRVRALRELTKQKHFTRDDTFACLVIPDGANAAEIALAENTARTAMHAADQALVFRNLIEKDGMDITGIAARFNTNERQVRRALAIANVHKDILKDYRSRDINYDIVKAFAGIKDPTEQLTVYRKIREHNWSMNPQAVKSFLSNARESVFSNELLFVGIQDYIDAGGQIEEDLFADKPKDALYAINPELIKALIDKKLAGYTEKFNGKWNWIKTSQDMNSYDIKTKYDSIPPVKISERMLAGARSLSQEVSGLARQLYTDSDVSMENLVEKTSPVTAKIDMAVEKLIDAINKAQYDDYVMDNGGIFIVFDYSMVPNIEAGLLDKRFLKEKRKQQSKVAAAARVTHPENQDAPSNGNGAQHTDTGDFDDKVPEWMKDIPAPTERMENTDPGSTPVPVNGSDVTAVPQTVTPPAQPQAQPEPEDNATLSDKFLQKLSYMQMSIVKLQSLTKTDGGVSLIQSLFLFHLVDKFFNTDRLPDAAFDVHLHRVPAYPVWMREDSERNTFRSYASSIGMLREATPAVPDWSSHQSVITRYNAFMEQDNDTRQRQINTALSAGLMPNPLFIEDIEDSLFAVLLSKLDIHWRDFMNLNEEYFHNLSKAALFAVGKEITGDNNWIDRNTKKDILVNKLTEIVNPATTPPHLSEDVRTRAANWLPPVLKIGIVEARTQ